jgi:hypothetical protein
MVFHQNDNGARTKTSWCNPTFLTPIHKHRVISADSGNEEINKRVISQHKPMI